MADRGRWPTQQVNIKYFYRHFLHHFKEINMRWHLHFLNIFQVNWFTKMFFLAMCFCKNNLHKKLWSYFVVICMPKICSCMIQGNLFLITRYFSIGIVFSLLVRYIITQLLIKSTCQLWLFLTLTNQPVNVGLTSQHSYGYLWADDFQYYDDKQ